MIAADTPLTGPPPPEVPLTDPPLVRVIAQVRFPLIASVEKRDFIPDPAIMGLGGVREGSRGRAAEGLTVVRS